MREVTESNNSVERIKRQTHEEQSIPFSFILSAEMTFYRMMTKHNIISMLLI